MSDLQKLFVLVPSDSTATVEAIKTASNSNNKVYFMAKYNQIVAKGTVYGVDPSTGNELKTLINVVGGTVNKADGTVTVDFSNLNYYTSEGTKTIIGAIEAIDAKVKAEMDKLAASKTLNNNYEFSGQIKYVAAAGNVAAHIALVDEAGAELSIVPVSDIIGNGVLKTSAYDAATGILTLTFAQADGTEKPVEVDLKAMLDINDVSIADGSKNYLEVALGEANVEGNAQAVFGAKIVKVAEATDAKTGLVDAKDVKDYVDGKTTNLAVEAAGDEYITAAVDPTNNKKIKVSADVQNVTYTAGTHATYNGEGAVATAATAANITGVTKSLVDGAQATTAIKSYVDFVVAEEALRADAKVLAGIKALDKESTTVDGSNIHVTYKEDDGIVTVESVSADFANVTRKETTSTPGAPKTDAAITVKSGDETKFIKASDLASVATYAAEKVTEEAHRVDKKIAETIDALDVAAVEKGNNVKVTISEANGKVALDSVVENYATVAYVAAAGKSKADLTVTNGSYLIVGNDIASVKQYVDAHVAESVAAKNVSAEGDSYIGVSYADNKITINANIGAFSYAAGKVSGEAGKLINGADAANAINSYVAAAIDKEVIDRNTAITSAIEALDVTEATTGDKNVVISYSETNGKVAVSASVNYATVTYEPASGEKTTADLSVENGAYLAVGNDIASVKQYVDAHVTEAVAALDSTIAEKDGSEFVTVTTTIANGMLDANASSVAVVYASHTKDDTKNAGKSSYTNGVATGAFVNAVLGDLWETYTA